MDAHISSSPENPTFPLPIPVHSPLNCPLPSTSHQIPSKLITSEDPPPLPPSSPPLQHPSTEQLITPMSPGNQKEPNDSSKKRSPEPIDNPPAKRPRDPTKPKRRLTWYDTIRDAWPILEKENSGRQEFRMREIVKTVETHWTHLRGEEKKQKTWRNQLSKAIRKEAMLTRAQSDGQSDLFAMKDPDYQPLPPRPMKRAIGPENDTPVEESTYHLSIPAEWTTEAYKPVRISPFDKSIAIQLVDEDSNTIKGHKGYRMARATSGVMEGDWYFEATIIQLRDPADTADGAVRLGWAQRRSDVETPVGFDAYGFGLRDRTGEFIHAARLKPYGEKFGVGDVIGCRISLPQLTAEQKASVDEADRMWLNYRFISMLQGQPPQDSGIDIIKDGTVQFYKNGTAMGVPSFFEDGRKAALSAVAEQVSPEQQNENRQQRKGKADVKDKAETTNTNSKLSNAPKREMRAGVYYPTIALYGNAIVRANFGPDFQYTRPQGCRPMCDAAREAPIVEEKEVIEILDDTPSNPTRADPPAIDSAPPQPPIPIVPLCPGQGQTARIENLNRDLDVEEDLGAAQRRTEEEEEEAPDTADARMDTGRDLARKGTDQPHLEPMAIEA